MRASIAQPVRGRDGGSGSRSPRAMRIWSSTRSSPELLGDAVLDLEPRVHLEERRAAVGNQVLDGADADIADAPGQRDGALLQARHQLRVETGRRRLLQHLLVAALHRAVAASECERAPVGVGGDLHLDVAAPREASFHEQAVVAEGGARLCARRLEGGRQVLGPLDHADAAPAAAGAGLDHDRVADLLRCAARGLQIGQRRAAPRQHGHAGALGHQLRADLVAERAHHRAGRAEEAQSARDHGVGELGILGDEAPARPDGVGAAGDDRRQQRLAVEVGAHGATGRRVEQHRGVGVAHEGQVAVDGGIERHTAELRALRLAQRLDAADAAHRSLAAVGDRDAADRGDGVHGRASAARPASRAKWACSISARRAAIWRATSREPRSPAWSLFGSSGAASEIHSRSPRVGRSE